VEWLFENLVVDAGENLSISHERWRDIFVHGEELDGALK
jgi:hypothetical protein